ncbi:MAG: TIGR02646 family protein [Defluviicoccus sp.]|nr:TIGR02646 family protein [Defluviicoccus sp.]
MRGSDKGPEPAELRGWKAAQRAAGVEPVYDDFRHPEKGATMSALFAEQTGQCVYCGRGISLAPRHCHIEHFRPRSGYPRLQLDHANLFLSCGPEGERGPRQTCGNRKDDWFDEDCHIPPAPDSCAERFRFRSSGAIVGDGTPEADRMMEVLNLNHPELSAERRDLIDDLERELAHGTSPARLRYGYLEENPDGARPGFANVALGYLRGQANAAGPPG